MCGDILMSEFLTIINKIDKFEYGGICGAIAIASGGSLYNHSIEQATSAFIEDKFRQWYSGDELYPIDHPNENAKRAYYTNHSCNDDRGYPQYRERRRVISESMKQHHHKFTITNGCLNYHE